MSLLTPLERVYLQNSRVEGTEWSACSSDPKLVNTSMLENDEAWMIVVSCLLSCSCCRDKHQGRLKF
ncbi:hypothetical protein ILYODFUR_023713 [Ilyodon furcidens]|uniref:Uncharacterized protein n=1 Tax=Ilyodon furcidens TaxID=33524 RepID=A0ABV0VGK5_9TELE